MFVLLLKRTATLDDFNAHSPPPHKSSENANFRDLEMEAKIAN